MHSPTTPNYAYVLFIVAGQGEAHNNTKELIAPLFSYEAAIGQPREFLLHSSVPEELRWFKEILRYTEPKKNAKSSWTWRTLRKEIHQDKLGSVLANAERIEAWGKEKKDLTAQRTAAKQRNDKQAEKDITKKLEEHRGTPRTPEEHGECIHSLRAPLDFLLVPWGCVGCAHWVGRARCRLLGALVAACGAQC